MGPPEIKTPHPDQLGGETGKRGGTSPEGRHADDTPRPWKARRGLRLQAQGQAQRILTARARATQPGRYPGDVYRTASCLWSKVADVSVVQSIEHGSAHYTGLVTCGSVWACPTCAAKIQERRRQEIEHAMTWAKSSGLAAIMPTFTFPHRSFHTLAGLLEKQAEAFKLLRKTRAYRRVMERIGFRGLIRSLEVTHGGFFAVMASTIGVCHPQYAFSPIPQGSGGGFRSGSERRLRSPPATAREAGRLAAADAAGRRPCEPLRSAQRGQGGASPVPPAKRVRLPSRPATTPARVKRHRRGAAPTPRRRDAAEPASPDQADQVDLADPSPRRA